MAVLLLSALSLAYHYSFIPFDIFTSLALPEIIMLFLTRAA
jgi:hypothetical protein